MNIYQYYNNKTKTLGDVFGLCESHFLFHVKPPNCDLISLGINEQFQCKHCFDKLKKGRKNYHFDGITFSDKAKDIDKRSVNLIENRKEYEKQLTEIYQEIMGD